MKRFKFLVLLLLGSLLAAKKEAPQFSRREELQFEKQISKLKQLNWGFLAVTMLQARASQSQLNELIDSQIAERQQEASLFKESFERQQSKYYKLQQQLKQQLLDLQGRVGAMEMTSHGVLADVKEYNENNIIRINAAIQEGQKKIEQKKLSFRNLQKELGEKLQGLTAGVDQIDQIVMLIDQINSDATRKGMSFFQMKGRIDNTLEELAKLKQVKSDTTILNQLLQMGIKNNFDNASMRKQIETMFQDLRFKLIGDINSMEVADQLKKLQEEINQLEAVQSGNKAKLKDESEALVENKEQNEEIIQNSVLLKSSLVRLQSEFELLKQQQNQETAIQERKQESFRKEILLFQELKKALADPHFVEFIAARK